MRAWLLDESPGEYRLGEVTTPEPGPGEVRIRVIASALNHIDVWLTRGMPRPPTFPHVPGADVAGVIDAVGDGVVRWNTGDEVVMEPAVTTLDAILRRGADSVVEPGMTLLGEHRWGGHADFVVVPEWHPLPRPPGRSWTDCAAYPVAYVTAWRMLRKAALAPRMSILVPGIGGGVAVAALALGRRLGVDVYVTSRDPAKAEWALANGASGAFDSSGPYPVTVDAVIDTVGGPTFDASMKALRNGGRFVTCGATGGVEVPLNIPRLFFRHHEIIGVTLGSHQDFCEVTELVADGLDVIVDRVVDFEEYPSALEHLRGSGQIGKVVLSHT